MDCEIPSSSHDTTLARELKRLSDELEAIKENIKSQDPEDVELLDILNNEKDKLELDVKTARKKLSTYREDRKDRTPELMNDVSKAEANIAKLNERILASNNEDLRLNLLRLKRKQIQKKEHAEKQLEVSRAKRDGRVLEDLLAYESAALRIKLTENNNDESARIIKRQSINQQYKTVMTAGYGTEHFENWGNHPEKESPTKKRRYHCGNGLRGCTWSSTFSRSRTEHERECRHR